MNCRVLEPSSDDPFTRAWWSIRSLLGAALPSALLALFLAAPAFANQWAAEGNVSLNGTRLTYYPDPDQGRCLATCNSNGQCQGATWIQAGTYNRSDPAMCYLLSAVTARVAARGHVSMVKTVAAVQPPPVTNQVPAEGNTSLNGTRLTYYADASQARCLATCQTNGQCRGATWIQAGTYNPGDAAMCYLLSAVTARVPARGHFSLVKGIDAPPPSVVTPPPSVVTPPPSVVTPPPSVVTPPPSVVTPPANTTRATWYTKTDFNTPNGTRISFACPPIGSDGYQGIWGTDVYAYGSGVCMAGVHVGVITRERGGVVTVEIMAGQSSHPGSTRNGVVSQSYGAYEKSFAVVR